MTTKRKSILLTGMSLVGFAILLLLQACNGSNSKEFDPSFTLSTSSYKPYDIKFFKDEVEKNAKKSFVLNTKAFNYANENFNFVEGNTDSTSLVIVASPYFYPNETEVNFLKNYVTWGNYALICSYNISSKFLDSLYYSKENTQFQAFFPPYLSKNPLEITYISTDDESETTYTYLGHSPHIRNLDSITLYSNHSVWQIDTLIKDKKNDIVMLEIMCGNGKIFLSNNPMILSNYFLLHKQNYAFFNQLAEKMELSSRKVIYDSFYKRFDHERKDDEDDDSSFFLAIVHKYPPLTWAFYTFLGAIGLFILIYFRRIQQQMRVLPIIENNSLAFINVISGLYWQHQDHRNIAEKMVQHFYETLAGQYRIYPKDFQEMNLESIAQKTGKSQALLEQILVGIRLVNNEEISAKQLTELYKNFYLFYR